MRGIIMLGVQDLLARMERTLLALIGGLLELSSSFPLTSFLAGLIGFTNSVGADVVVVLAFVWPAWNPPVAFPLVSWQAEGAHHDVGNPVWSVQAASSGWPLGLACGWWEGAESGSVLREAIQSCRVVSCSLVSCLVLSCPVLFCPIRLDWAPKSGNQSLFSASKTGALVTPDVELGGQTNKQTWRQH